MRASVKPQLGSRWRDLIFLQCFSSQPVDNWTVTKCIWSAHALRQSIRPFPPIYPTELKVLRNAQKIFRSTQKCSNEILAEVLLRSTLATGCHRHQLHQLHQNQMTPSPRKRCPRNLCSNCSSSNPLGPLSASAFDESVPLHLCICFS